MPTNDRIGDTRTNPTLQVRVDAEHPGYEIDGRQREWRRCVSGRTVRVRACLLRLLLSCWAEVINND